MQVVDSVFFHQFIVAGMIGFLLGYLSVALVQVPRWLVAMLSD